MKKLGCLLFSILAMTIPVYANSALTWWQGNTASGAIIIEENCPLVITHEQLTFDIHEFPREYYDSIEDYLAYQASVTAEYTISNPADYDVSVRLVFPFGTTPDYGDIYDHDQNIRYINQDTEKYQITVDNEVIPTKLRHTFKFYYDEFSLEDDLPLLKDGFTDHEFYHFELPVTELIYQISDVDTENYRSAFTSFQVPKEMPKTKIYMPQAHGFDSKKDTVQIGTWVENDMEVSVYIIGEPLNKLNWTVYEDGSEEKEIPGNIQLVETKTMTFKDLAFTYYNPESQILEHDWYNALIANFDLFSYTSSFIGMDAQLNITENLLRWYDYTLTVPAKTTVINSVSAPMYPSIDAKYEPPVYEYSYLLSPAKSWKEFKNLDIQINTKHHLISSSLDDFEKAETGYHLSLDELPDNELTFELSSEANPKKTNNTIYYIRNFLLGISVIFIQYALPVLALLFFISKYRKPK